MTPQQTVAALVLRARGGDQAAYTKLVHRFEGFAHHLATEFFVRGADWDDGYSEAMHGLVKAVQDWRPDGGSGFNGFACLCMRRQILTAVTLAQRQKHRPLNEAARFSARVIGAADDEDAELGTLLPDRQAPDPQDEMERRERIGEVVALVRRLTPLERRALDGLASGASYEEISEQTGIPFKSIDNALTRARRKYSRQAVAA
jgi:RNA polymerase sporulation-specific sigma factor